MRHPETGEWVRAGFSFRLFLNARRETFFAFVLYGREFVINAGGPSIKGYDEWLKENGSSSPLIEGVGLTLRSKEVDGVTTHYLDTPTDDKK